MSDLRLPDLETKPDISITPFSELTDSLTNDPSVKGSGSADLCQLDPRDGSMVVYAEHRSLRRDEHKGRTPARSTGCPVCAGKLTQVVDYAAQSDGFTFISQNMYPVLYPQTPRPIDPSGLPLYPDPHHLGRVAFGFHLLQWSSSIHELDWHNLPLEDVLVCMQRLQRLEHKLLTGAQDYMPRSDSNRQFHGYLSIIKNYGAPAGSSLTHGHQQIAFSNIMPQRMYNNARFFERQQRTLSQFLWDDNPQHLTVAEHGPARVIVPYFMRRPYNVLILLRTQAEYLHQLDSETLHSATQAAQKVAKAYHRLLPLLGREVSYNMAIHTGPKNHLYLEFFPIVQASGGFERIGLWVCQLSAEHAAEQLKEVY